MPALFPCPGLSRGVSKPFQHLPTMAREIVILECTEARKEGKRPSRYMSTRNKKTMQDKVEKLKYNPSLRRHTLHKEIKS